jgi:hypothetical protein
METKDGTIGTPEATLIASAANATPAQPETKRFLSRKAILDADDIETEDVYIEEWKGHVRVKALTIGEREKLETESMVPDPSAPRNKPREKFSTLNFRARLVVLAAIDSNTGAPLFDDTDVPRLSKKAAGPVNKLAERAMKLSKISDEDVEEIAKNYDSGPKDGSSSGSLSSNSTASRPS